MTEIEQIDIRLRRNNVTEVKSFWVGQNGSIRDLDGLFNLLIESGLYSEIVTSKKYSFAGLINKMKEGS